jgi:hypothetical protein
VFDRFVHDGTWSLYITPTGSTSSSFKLTYQSRFRPWDPVTARDGYSAVVQNKTERLDGLGVGGAFGKMPILQSFGKFDNNHIFFLHPG